MDKKTNNTNSLNDICQCAEGPTLGDTETRCHRCGRLVNVSEEYSRNSSQFDNAREIEPSASAISHSQVLASGLPSLPAESDPSGEGNNCATGVGVNASEQHGQPSAEKVPVHSHLGSSVKIPCEGTHFTFFILVQNHPEIDEQWFGVHFVPTERFEEGRISNLIQTMHDQQGIRIVCMGDEYLSQMESGYFHTAFIDTHICSTITFQLVKAVKFRIRDAQTAYKVPLHKLYALAQHRVPGAIARVFVECLAEPNETCQDHLRMTLEYGNVIRHMLIPIWDNCYTKILDYFKT